jgi:hypothetical protein
MISVESSNETEVAVMTVLTEVCEAEASPPIEERQPVVTAILGTVISSCQIRFVGPTGKEKVIDLRGSPFLLLWIYLIARTVSGGWVRVGDLLADVYGYDGPIKDEKTGLMDDPKERLQNRFHDHHRVLRGLFDDAQDEVGLPRTKVLLCKREEKTSWWRLSDEVQIEDLAYFQECEAMLSGNAKAHEKRSHASVKAACERVLSGVENLSTLLTIDETHEPWILQMAEDSLVTYCNALKYLAADAHTEARKASDEQVKRTYQQMEAQYWTTYTLCCARIAGKWSEKRKTLRYFGERGLQKTLPLLHDPERAANVYSKFKRLVERSGKRWKPTEETEQCWQKALAEIEAA